MTERRPFDGVTQSSLAWGLFGAVVLLGIPLFIVSTPSDADTSVAGEPRSTDVEEAADDTDDQGTESDDPTAAGFTMSFVGDVLVHESVADQASENAGGDGYEFDPMFDDVSRHFEESDLSICHLETPLSASNDDLSYYPAFRVPNQLADTLAAASIDGCSFASNHTLDAGRSGVESTLEAMSDAGVAVTGAATAATEPSSHTYEVGPYSVGHLSYTYGLNAPESLPAGEDYLVDIIDAQKITGEAAALRSGGADFVVVSLQWGEEYRSEPTADQQNDAVRLLSSPDIDLIVGHHAHVVQPIERIGDEYVIYGLGNFLSNQSAESCDCPEATQDGVILSVHVAPDETGALVATRLTAIPTRVDRSDYTIIDTLDETGIERLGESVAAASAQRTLAVLDANEVLDR